MAAEITPNYPNKSEQCRKLMFEVLKYSDCVEVFAEMIDSLDVQREDIISFKMRHRPTVLEVTCSFGFISIFSYLVRRFDITLDEIKEKRNVCLDIALSNGKIDIVNYFINEFHATADDITESYKHLRAAFDVPQADMARWLDANGHRSDLERPAPPADLNDPVIVFIDQLMSRAYADLGPKSAAKTC